MFEVRKLIAGPSSVALLSGLSRCFDQVTKQFRNCGTDLHLATSGTRFICMFSHAVPGGRYNQLSLLQDCRVAVCPITGDLLGKSRGTSSDVCDAAEA